MSPSEELTKLVQSTTGPSPLYWETFPELRGFGGRRYRWRFHGHQEGLRGLVTLAGDGERGRARLALNPKCRPFLLEENRIGIWFPERSQVRFVCFEPDRMQPFDLDEISGWFANSLERTYAATPPLAEFFLETELQAGVYELAVPEPFRSLDELLVPTSYPCQDKNDPAFAILVLYAQGELLEVLPQRWITHVNYDVTSHWITRATRDPETHLILGELARVGAFELRENGRDFGRWL